jgi:uncharacterized SAM-binding protein YcdF (DUF218 family)
MFFIAAKVLGFFALPSNLIISLGCVGVLIMLTRYARIGCRLIVGSVLLYALFGFSPLGNALILPLEQRFPAWDSSRGPPDGAVVLGGAFDTLVALTRGDVPLNEAGDRLTAAAELARRYPDMRIVFSGGSGLLVSQGAKEADLALRLFESMGISRGRIALESRARDTGENARLSKEIAAPKAGERWLLVTSAYHMPRAIGAFRRVGFFVEAYPVDWRTRGRQDLLHVFAAAADGLKRSDTAMREWIGLFVYWLTGRIIELLPRP